MKPVDIKSKLEKSGRRKALRWEESVTATIGRVLFFLSDILKH